MAITCFSGFGVTNTVAHPFILDTPPVSPTGEVYETHSNSALRAAGGIRTPETEWCLIYSQVPLASWIRRLN